MLSFKLERVKNRMQVGDHIIRYINMHNAYLAGGSLRSIFMQDKDEVVDYDIFFRSLLNAATLEIDLVNAGYEVIYKCPEGKLTTLKHKNPEQAGVDGVKIQLITEFTYPDIDVLIDSFDINAARICLYKDTIYTDRRAIRDLRRKRITLNEVIFPVATFKRLQKYQQKGFALPNDTIKYFVNTIHDRGLRGLELNDRVYVD